MARLAFRILLAIALLPGALAAAEPGTEARRTDELMRKSGLWKQVGQIQSQVKAGAAQAREESHSHPGAPHMTDAEAARLQAAIGAAFEPERLRAAVARGFAAELSAKDEDEVLAWLTSELGARITALEEDSGEAEALMQPEREAGEFLASVPAARLEKFERFANTVHAGESSAAGLINVTTAIVLGMALATPPSDTSGVEALRKRLESQRPQMVVAFTRQAVMQFAYLYRTLSDAEVDRYLAFAETPSGHRYHDATMKVLEDVLTHASLDMGREIGRMMPAESRRSS